MIRVRGAVLLLLGFSLMLGACGLCVKAGAAEYPPTPAPIPPGKGLFGSHEFRSSLKALPQWSKVMASAQAQVEEMSGCDPGRDHCSAAALSWQKIIGEARGQEPMQQLKTVNSFFNRWPYRLDIDTYGLNEYWATPQEFLRFSGDCEDYSITKYYALKKLGLPVDSMRIVILQDTIRGISHAVLAVRLGNDSYILDNLSDLLLPHQRYEHYLPQYSVNEHYRWAHVSPGLMR